MVFEVTPATAHDTPSQFVVQVVDSGNEPFGPSVRPLDLIGGNLSFQQSYIHIGAQILTPEAVPGGRLVIHKFASQLRSQVVNDTLLAIAASWRRGERVTLNSGASSFASSWIWLKHFLLSTGSWENCSPKNKDQK